MDISRALIGFSFQQVENEVYRYLHHRQTGGAQRTVLPALVY